MAYTPEEIEGFSSSKINSMSKSELEEVIKTLDELIDRHEDWSDAQRRVYSQANKKLREYNEHLSKTESKLHNISGVIGGIGGAISSVLNMEKQLAGPWAAADDAAFNFGKSLGTNATTAERLRDETIKFANTDFIGAKYNTSTAEMIKLQENYAKSVGRNIQLSDKQKETLLATSKIMGENTTEFAKKLENLGVGLERSGDLAAKMYNEAAKSGISFEKTSKYVTENLTKVQSYGFKNGVEGLTAMAKKAAEVNLNINEAFKVADKIQSGGIQEAIKMGAGLQVLGGNFASMGDPMGLLYQGLNDVEGLQDRMVKMFTGYGGIQNGEFKISGANRLLVNQAAQTLGVSQDEMYNMISRQAVRERVEQQMSSNPLLSQDAELAELVKNTATLNKDNQAVVNINGKEKKLSEVDESDKQYLKDMQKSEADDIKDIAQMMRGYTDYREGLQKGIENKRAQFYGVVGDLTKKAMKWMGEQSLLTTIIAGIQTAGIIANGIGGVLRGFGSSFRSGRSLFGGGGSTGGAPGVTPGGAPGVVPGGTPGGAPGGGSNWLFKPMGVAGGLAGGALAGAGTAIGYALSGDWKGDQSQKTKALSGTIGSAVLGGIATAFAGPIVGMLGAQLGKAAGEWVGKGIDKSRQKKKNEFVKELGGAESEKGKILASLSDNYSRKELEKIKKAISDGTISDGELSDKIIKKMAKSGDSEIVKDLLDVGMRKKMEDRVAEMNASVEQGNFNMESGNISIGNANISPDGTPVAKASGGKLFGPSDVNGPGMPILGSNIVVGGGEYVVNADATKKNERLLDRINSGETVKFSKGGQLPTIHANNLSISPSSALNPMKPLSVRPTSPTEVNQNQFGTQGKIEVQPIKLDVSGTIKLDADGKQVDLQSIINNPAFLTELAQLINRRISDDVNGGNFKELRKNKQHTF